jgi:hypothetical protein
MAEISETTLRLDVLREARDRYLECVGMTHTTAAECKLYQLKIAECDAMIKELLRQS